MGLPVRHGDRSAVGRRVQSGAAAAEHAGAMGGVAEDGRRSVAGRVSRQGVVREGRAPISTQMVILQLDGHPRPDSTLRRQLRIFPSDSIAL